MAYVFQTFRKDGTPHPKWKYQYKDRWNRKRTATGYMSKRDTERLANRIEEDERQIRQGIKEVPKPCAVDHDIHTVVQDYLNWGNTCGGREGNPWGKKHALERKSKLTWWIDQLNLKKLKDLKTGLTSVEKLLQNLKGENKSNKTIANYAEAIHAFCEWCVNREYFADSPLKKLTRIKMDVQTERRSLTTDEIQRLLDVAPLERKVLYKVALCTGLRANELRELTVRHLDIDNCGLHLDPAWTKNRKKGFQPLPEDLVKELVQLIESGLVDDKYLKNYVRKECNDVPQGRLLYILQNPVKAFNEDLKNAAIPKITDEGKLDFHALRTTFSTMVVESDANLKEIQTMVRHSNPNITMNRYAKNRKGRSHQIANQIYERVIQTSEIDKKSTPIDTAGQKLSRKLAQLSTKENNADSVTLINKGSCERIRKWRRRELNPRPKMGLPVSATCLVSG